MKLSEHFKEIEFTRSDTAAKQGIDNTIQSPVYRENLIVLASFLEQVRTLYGAAINISSGYRCPDLNKAVGGVDTSQHVIGEAADCRVNDPVKLFKLLRSSDLQFDQIILYPTFVHVSHTRHRANRRQVLYAKGVEAV